MKKQKPKKNKAKKAVRTIKPVETYMDYASATPISSSVQSAMTAKSGVFANPGGIHAKSIEAKKLIQDARKTIADAIEARSDEIVFTGSATEANTLAILGATDAWQKINEEDTPHIIISAIEHASVMEIAALLEDDGVEVTRLPVDKFGVVDLAVLKSSLKKNTVIVSVMYANNEIGTIEPLYDIAKMIRHFKKENQSSEYPLLHSDCAQGFQYLPIRVVKPGVDLMTISSSKIYGPRGVAMLYVKDGTTLATLMPGGGQESGLRGGTEATQLIVGFAKAVEDAVKLREKESARLTKILERGKHELAKHIPDAKLLGHPTLRLPNNLTFSIKGIESDYLVLELSAKKIYASSRSACKSDSEDDKELDSHVIMAIGGEPTDGTVRLSFGRDTRLSDIRSAIKVTKDAVTKWRTWSHAHTS